MPIYEFACPLGHVLDVLTSSFNDRSTRRCFCGCLAQYRFSGRVFFNIDIFTPVFHPGFGKVIRTRDEEKAELDAVSERYGVQAYKCPDIDHITGGDSEGVTIKGYTSAIVDSKEGPKATPGYRHPSFKVSDDELSGRD